MGTHHLRILHLSDLHERVALDWMDDDRKAKIRLTKASRYNVLSDGFFEIINKIGQDQGIDLVVFTGDVADWGLKEEYDQATNFFTHVLDETGTSPKHFYAIPGNHDIQRSTNEDEWKLFREVAPTNLFAISNILGGMKAIPGLEKLNPDAILKREEAFWNWLGGFRGSDDLDPKSNAHGRLGYRTEIDHTDTPFPITLIGFDSAWLCGDDNDDGKLALTSGQVDVLSNDEEGKPFAGFRIGLVHHPLSKLMDEKDVFNKLATNRIDLLLHGHQHDPITQLIQDPDRELRIIAAGSLYEGDQGDKYINGFQHIDIELTDEGRPVAYTIRFFGWSPNGFWHEDGHIYKNAPGGVLTLKKDHNGLWQTKSTSRSKTDSLTPDPKKHFVAREQELEDLQNALLPSSSDTRKAIICGIQGMAGVGKTFLAEEFYARNALSFPGGMRRIVFTPEDSRPADQIIAGIAEDFKVQWTNEDSDLALIQSLQMNIPLIHLENVDSAPLATVVTDVAIRLKSIPVVITGRYTGFHEHEAWYCQQLKPFMIEDSLSQLEEELETDVFASIPEEKRIELVESLGGLPLAIHLACGYLRNNVDVDSFLSMLIDKNLSLKAYAVNDPEFSGTAKQTLQATFNLSYELMVKEFADSEYELYVGAFRALAVSPRAGFELDLGAAIGGVSQSNMIDILTHAARYSLLDLIPRSERSDGAWRMHPLVREFLGGIIDLDSGNDTEKTDAYSRFLQWVLVQISGDIENERSKRWSLVSAEMNGIIELIEHLPIEHLPNEQTINLLFEAEDYIDSNGPYHYWLQLANQSIESATASQKINIRLMMCYWAYQSGLYDSVLMHADRVIQDQTDENNSKSKAIAWGYKANIYYQRGNLDEALRIRQEEELPVFESLGDIRSKAVTMGQIADIYYTRGNLDEALRIRQEEELPVYESLGDIRSKAVTMGQIADIYYTRGNLDEALRIRQEEQLLVYESLGDIREKAVTMGKIADIYYDRGNLDETLRIRQEEELPVFESLGDIRSKAVTMGKIADIYYDRGNLDEALRIQQEELPVYEKLQAKRDVLVCKANIGIVLLKMNKISDRNLARTNLLDALRLANELHIPERKQIKQILIDNSLETEESIQKWMKG